VHEVRNRRHVDLRQSGALHVFNSSNIDFGIFLACEVGGSKFLENSAENVQQQIILSNIHMFDNVFPWFQERNVPFIFASTYLQKQYSAYGTIKRLGEIWVRQMPHLGRTARFWNVYGPEPVGLRSHVLSDWIAACLSTGQVMCRTDGHEARQFLHADDAANALVNMMREFVNLDPITDISSGVWSTLRDIAGLLSSQMKDSCKISYNQSNVAIKRELVAPLEGKWFWTERWATQKKLEKGIEEMIVWHRENPDRRIEEESSSA